MKKRLIYLSILLSIFPLWLSAQQVSGRLIDEQQQPVEFAN
jgi:hypothetical protein